jgi:hypothetical protein
MPRLNAKEIRLREAKAAPTPPSARYEPESRRKGVKVEGLLTHAERQMIKKERAEIKQMQTENRVDPEQAEMWLKNLDRELEI